MVVDTSTSLWYTTLRIRFENSRREVGVKKFIKAIGAGNENVKVSGSIA